MKDIITIRREHSASVRAYLIALLEENRQISVHDLIEEIGCKRYSVINQLRILAGEGKAHRLNPIAPVEQFQQVGQVWASGPAPEGDEADAVPLQISRHHWTRPSFQVSMLERLLFPSYGVMV